ncbi:hypothetical protein [Micromonospora sp. NPDC023633]|uniref:hypothetical protein n=1 Tax=Micromonospora sp. NPDC023633 TaxID=3154320 RepID=UPI0033BFC715
MTTTEPYAAGDAPTDRSFATYLTADARDQLDARAATAEQERDDALDDLRELRAHHTELHTRLNATENDLRSQTRAVRKALAERDQAREHVHHDIARQIAMLATDPSLLRDWLTTCQPQPTGFGELLHALADKLRKPSPAGLGSSCRAQEDELAPWIRRAIGDPGSIAGFRRGPHWPEGHEGWAEQAESVTAWSTRAVLRVLAVDGRPRCERCSQVIRVDDLYDPPLPGVGLWEHRGDCPPVDEREG